MFEKIQLLTQYPIINYFRMFQLILKKIYSWEERDEPWNIDKVWNF